VDFIIAQMASFLQHTLLTGGTHPYKKIAILKNVQDGEFYA
jgi:hypothetical protein